LRKQVDWGAHACSVLAIAFRDREPCDGAVLARLETKLKERSFRQNAETSTLQACAPQTSAITLLAPASFVGRLQLQFSA
jgi:hypothetical protein